MNQNAELLNYIYQNSQMGVDTIKRLVEIVEDDAEFKKQLNSQYNEYKNVHEQAKEMLNKNGLDEKGLNAYEKVRTYLMLNFQTLTDKSPSHIAEMLIIGSNMGVIDAIKNIKKYQSAEKDILDLMGRLLAIEENNITNLKKYL